MGESLSAIAFARDIAIQSQRIARQNFSLAIGYNVLAVPVAMLGLASPLIAAVAMSTSSIIVIANALRLSLVRLPRLAATPDRENNTPAEVERRKAA